VGVAVGTCGRRILDTWLLSRGAEVLLSPGSTMGYLAMGLAPPSTPVIMLATCKPPPTREASFHMLKKAIYHRSHSARALLRTCIHALLVQAIGRSHLTYLHCMHTYLLTPCVVQAIKRSGACRAAKATILSAAADKHAQGQHDSDAPQRKGAALAALDAWNQMSAWF
jgi:hypothetical protein